jgi:hypothetical protein
MRIKSAFVVVVTMLLLMLAACESIKSGSAQQDSGPQRAVFVSGGNGGGTTIYLPSTDGKSVVMLSDGNGHMCPDCEAAAKKYFDTGLLEPKCPTCGATRTAFTLPSSSIGHN